MFCSANFFVFSSFFNSLLLLARTSEWSHVSDLRDLVGDAHFNVLLMFQTAGRARPANERLKEKE